MPITAAQLMIKVSADTTEAESRLGSISSRLDGFASSAARVGAVLTAGITAPMALIGRQAMNLAAQFDANMNVLQATSGATAEQIESLRAEAEALGADLTLPATSAADAAEAMLELSKAGLSVNDTMAAARGVLQLSAAGNLSNAAAAEIAANALNAFGLEGKEAERVADLLAAAANASSGEVADMADSLKMASAVAKSANIPIEDVVTAISLMANAGVKGSDAGTSFKQMLLSLQAPSARAAELMESLGIRIYDAAGNMLPLPQIIENFSAALSGLSQEQRNAALATIFGSDAVRAANIVLMGGVDAFNQMKDAVTEEGAAAELAGARMKGLGGALEALRNSLETAMLAGVEPLKDDIEGLARGIAEAVIEFSKLDEGTRDLIVKIALLAAGIGPAMIGVSALAKAASGAIRIFGGLKMAIEGAGLAIKAWQAGMTLTTSLGAAGLSPIAITLGAIALAVGAVVAVWATWNEQIVKTNKEGAKAVSETWSKFFQEQSEAGKTATQVVSEYLAAQERARQVLENTNPIVRAFISNQEQLVGSYDQLSNTVAGLSTSYDEYRSLLERVAEANGLVIDSEGNLVQIRQHSLGQRREIVQENYLLSESEYAAAQAQQFVNEVLYEGTNNALAYSGAANDVGVTVAQMEKSAAAAAGAMDQLSASTTHAATAAMQASALISTLNQALADAGWSSQQIEAATQGLSIALGETSAEMVQLENDVRLLADAFAAGVINADEFTSFMQQAKDGTLALDEAQRQQIQSALDQANALKTAAEAAKQAAIEQLNLAQSLKGATDAQIAQAAISKLGQAYESGQLSFESYIEAVTQVQDTFGLADDKSRALAAGLMELTRSLQEGLLPAQNYDEALQALIQDAQDGTVDMQALLEQLSAAPGQIQPATASIDDASDSLDEFGQEAAEAAQEAQDAAQDIERAFTAPDWRGLGRDIAAGIAEGIRSGTSEIEQAAADAANAALSAAQQASQTQSPSRKFMELGYDMMAGEALGIRRGAMEPLQETISVTREIIRQTHETISQSATGNDNRFMFEQIAALFSTTRASQPIQLTINIAGHELRKIIVDAVAQELVA